MTPERRRSFAHCGRHSVVRTRARVASLQFQKDAKELAELCAAIPGEMNDVNQGLVSKDLLEKLKRVEKLSKRVREQLTRASPVP